MDDPTYTERKSFILRVSDDSENIDTLHTNMTAMKHFQTLMG
jgi:hypothetical protein